MKKNWWNNLQHIKNLSIALLITITPLSKPISITYQKHNGRMGDCLINYIKSKYLAYRYNASFLYCPFLYSDHFAMHDQEKRWDNNEKFDATIHVQTENIFKQVTPGNNTLYVSNYYTRLPDVPPKEIMDSRYNADALHDYAIEHRDFYDEICQQLQPRSPYSVLPIPTKCITIAVHIRKGGGFDTPLYSKQVYTTPRTFITEPLPHKNKFADIGFPTKFPPDQYYIDQIKLISELLDNPPLFVFIFTDDSQPSHLVETFKNSLNKKNISFGCRNKDNHHSKNVIEDFFNMAFHFDILIRSSSSFSWVAEFIGNHKFTILPLRGRWHKQMLIMDAIELGVTNKIKNKRIRYRIDLMGKSVTKKIISTLLKEKL